MGDALGALPGSPESGQNVALRQQGHPNAPLPCQLVTVGKGGLHKFTCPLIINRQSSERRDRKQETFMSRKRKEETGGNHDEDSTRLRSYHRNISVLHSVSAK